MEYNNFLKNREGTALLVALLVMGVLMAISLALSSLIFRETVITRDFLDAGKAYYAAESATEIGLYGLKHHLSGWEPGESYIPIKVDEAMDAVAELKVSNKCSTYPCFDEGSALTDDLKQYYAVLGLNESVTIPLFVVDAEGKEESITDFTVEFYAPFGRDDLNIKGGNVDGWDVLRWKIFGMNKGHTETISDFTAFSLMSAGKSQEQLMTGAQKPSWFGSIACSDSGISGRKISQIQCLPYTPITDMKRCTETQAREYYLYSYDNDGQKTLNLGGLKTCYPIKDFLSNHTLNYLTLTNLVNPSVFKEQRNDSLFKIYYRVELFKDGQPAKTAREYADIIANGYSGKSKQSINVKMRRDSFMPVFNFSLYSTYMKDEDYWYGKKEDRQLLPGQ